MKRLTFLSLILTCSACDPAPEGDDAARRDGGSVLADGGGTALDGGDAPATPSDAGGVTEDAPIPAAITGVYTDLVSAPVGAFVTVHGLDTDVSSWPVILHGDGRTVVQVPDATTPLTVAGMPLPVRVHEGRVILATPDTLRAAVDERRPGDTVYLRGGTYDGKYDSEGWNEANFVLFGDATEEQPFALVGYPGEVVRIVNEMGRPPFYLGGQDRTANHLVVSEMELIGQGNCIYGGGNTSDSTTPESGTTHVRVVGIHCTLTDSTSNTQTGMIALQGDHWSVLGNVFRDPADRVSINNNHAIYVQNGADDVEIAYNDLRYLHMGHVIQLHQDGVPMLCERIHIHHNLLEATMPDDMRGIVMGNIGEASTVLIEHNVLRNLGQDFSALAVFNGEATVRDNELYDIGASVLVVGNSVEGGRRIVASGNRFGVAPGFSYLYYDSGPREFDLTLSGNTYCGGGPPPAEDATGAPCP